MNKVILFFKYLVTGYRAYCLRKKISKVHKLTKIVLHSNKDRDVKDKEIVIPIRTLSNDIDFIMPDLKRKVREYRKIATDIYPSANDNRNINEKLQQLDELWASIDKKLTKKIYFEFGDMFFSLVFIFSVICIIFEIKDFGISFFKKIVVLLKK